MQIQKKKKVCKVINKGGVREKEHKSLFLQY